MKKPLILLLVLLASFAHGQGLRDLYQAGLKAYEEKNYEVFRDKMLSIDSLRPNYPAVVYNIASGYVLTGEYEKAVNTLNNYLLMDATRDFTEDEDFSNLISRTEFHRVKDEQEKLTKEIPITKKYNWSLNGSHPESIAYSEKEESYFIGGVRDGKIWRIRNNKEPEIFAEKTKNSWSVMGLEVSPDGKYLWACTSAMTFYEGYDQNTEGYSSVLKYDIKSGELLKTYRLEDGHNFGDLIVSKTGEVYLSDSKANHLYVIREGSEEIKLFVDLSKKVFSVQGLTFNEDQSAVYISDYIDGIYKINLNSRGVFKLKVKTEGLLLKGIDGLYYQDGSLIALHNGTKPNRIVSYDLSENGMSIIGKEVRAQAGTLGEPTQGVFIQNKFQFISNSPWLSYDQDGNFTPPQDPLIIGELK